MDHQRPSRPKAADFPAPQAVVAERSQVAGYISTTTLALAKQARGSGLTTLSLLLESAARRAFTDAISAQQGKDGPSP